MLDALLLLFLLATSAALIATTWRLPVEKRIRSRYGVDRSWWVPIVAVAVGIVLTVIRPRTVLSVFMDKIGVVLLIFSFGIFSEGLSASGFFTHVSYKVSRLAGGNTQYLIIGLFFVVSLFTFVTSNDIVILVTTPILIRICQQTRIENTRPLLLSQFVAANTLSMGLLIGSPTNIIMAQEIGIGFFSYINLMLAPTVATFATSTLILFLLLRTANTSRYISSFEVRQTYTIPDSNPEPSLTSQMKIWAILFTVFLTLVAVITYFHIPLVYCAIPSIVLALLYWAGSSTHEEPTIRVIKRLPYGVFFFAIAFFTLANAFGNTQYVVEQVLPVLSSTLTHGPQSVLVSTYGTGILVNVFNDLPTATLLSEVLPQAINLTSHKEVTQSVLVGLNIGAYVTQAGSLAGIIWFTMIDKYRSNSPHLELPTRGELVMYGFLNFAISGGVAVLVIAM